jgi:adenine-specific DNA-methyltransferase
MKELGQYFTKNESLLKNLKEFIKNKPKQILEPSIGQGHIIDYLKKDPNQKFQNTEYIMIEIDKKLIPLSSINKEEIHYMDFLEYNPNQNKKFETIIGNPPYVKKKGKPNLYVEFIKKCVNLLENNGELIFIIPSDFFQLTSSAKLINEMMSQGKFTHIYHPNQEKLFEEASIDVLIFRYQKTEESKQAAVNETNMIIYNNEMKYVNNNNGSLTFSSTYQNSIHNLNQNTTSHNKLIHIKIDDYFEVYVGMVSGNEKLLKNSTYGNIEILTGENNIEKYIFLTNYPTENKNLNDYLELNKEELKQRKLRKIDDTNWFEFGLPRNKKHIDKFINNKTKCLYMYNLTRKKDICFQSHVQYFGGNLLILIPKQEMNLEKIMNYFNSSQFKEQYMFSNRFKINHKNLKDCYVPYY